MAAHTSASGTGSDRAGLPAGVRGGARCLRRTYAEPVAASARRDTTAGLDGAPAVLRLGACAPASSCRNAPSMPDARSR